MIPVSASHVALRFSAWSQTHENTHARRAALPGVYGAEELQFQMRAEVREFSSASGRGRLCTLPFRYALDAEPRAIPPR